MPRAPLPPAALGSLPCCPGTKAPSGVAGAARRARSSRLADLGVQLDAQPGGPLVELRHAQRLAPGPNGRLRRPPPRLDGQGRLAAEGPRQLLIDQQAGAAAGALG